MSHERGTARLIRLVMAREFKSLRRDLAVNVQGELVYRGLAAHPLLNKELVAGRDLRDDLLDRVVITVFLEGREPLRSAAAFDARVDHAARRSRPAGAGTGARCAVRTRATGPGTGGIAEVAAPTAADIRAQLAWLVPAGFLLVTPAERLKDFPRYLQAIEQRLEKLKLDPRRDAQLAAEIAPLESRYRERVKAERGMLPPGTDSFRWLLEELRVSLFAQQLKTKVPISAKRLADAWAERERMTLG